MKQKKVNTESRQKNPLKANKVSKAQAKKLASLYTKAVHRTEERIKATQFLF